MVELFDGLTRGLGAVLGFFYNLLEFTGEGLALGFSIILLTIFVNILVFPLTLKQTRATRAFTEIQPDIRRIQKEYKEDPQEMQKQLMALQRSAGATPGGCLLPILVQMPIWFALFRLLQEPPRFLHPDTALGLALENGTVEAFLGMDLSVAPAQALNNPGGVIAALPYLIMIVLMVATQYVQQWHATYGQERPKGIPGAGAQQAIMRILPLFIGFVSWNFPAGLVLYWATGNVFRLGQQALIFKIDGRPKPVALIPEEPERKQAQASEEAVRKPQPGAANKRRRRRRR